MDFWIIYAIGCVFVVLGTMIKIILAFLHEVFAGNELYWKNLEKIGLYRDNISGGLVESKPSRQRAFVIFVFEIILSWINVPVLLWQICARVFALPSAFMDRRPERIKELAYPLMVSLTNTPESILARIIAISVINGVALTVESLRGEILAVQDRIDNFMPLELIERLRSLKLPEIDATVLNETRKWFEKEQAIGE